MATFSINKNNNIIEIANIHKSNKTYNVFRIYQFNCSMSLWQYKTS